MALPTKSSDSENTVKIFKENGSSKITFKSLGINEELCKVCKALKWKKPTQIQCEAIPVALQGRDIIGLAETGSGKTAAFALPIVQDLLKRPQYYFALVLTPTRELAFQIVEQFQALGTVFGIKVCALVGGVDMKEQTADIAKKPHIIVATPGRLFEHLTDTRGFTLSTIRYLVLDEADRILDMNFEDDVHKIMRVIPSERRTYLYSATMTTKVKKLERVTLKDPVKVEVCKKYQTVELLDQFLLIVPAVQKCVFLVYLLNEFKDKSVMIFCSTCQTTAILSRMLKILGMNVAHLNGRMTQRKRLASLYRFIAQEINVLIATDVASRGLDIPHIDVVLNYDVPLDTANYVHRVGRTARAGRAGLAITLVTQYDANDYIKVEDAISKKLTEYPHDKECVMVFKETAEDAEKMAREEIERREAKGKQIQSSVATASKRTRSSEHDNGLFSKNKKMKKKQR